MKVATRIEVLNALWEYIKFNKLQSKENKSIINNDVPLREIFGCDKLSIDTISLKLKSILQAPDPIVLTHHVKLTGDWKITEQIYDIMVETDFLPVNYEIMPLFSDKISVDEKAADKAAQANKSEHYLVSLSQKIKKLEKRATEYIDKLKKHKQKKACYSAYQDDPAKFIDRIILEQNNYLRHMADDGNNDTENPNSMKFLLENEDLIEREIKKYLDKKDDS